MVKKLIDLVAALSILNSSCASPGNTKKVAALVAQDTCSGTSHSSVYTPGGLKSDTVLSCWSCEWLSDESTGELSWSLGDIRWAQYLVLLLVR